MKGSCASFSRERKVHRMNATIFGSGKHAFSASDFSNIMAQV